ncbi:RNA pseudouridylate synthase domain-containing protein 2 isoform X4 [Rhinatrema bivittatum]|uniref:RNA pseudouridylate synthase domain-containing protein 2 isoform X4 n=1 Tax=Rhinatrema bivittatum TaxID=194408 RepID=UPI00112D3A2A|nr:RNA pseudouridylate synthase domain-containing protein 2 isoform X4 [Rhinatrema bivittatum]
MLKRGLWRWQELVGGYCSVQRWKFRYGDNRTPARSPLGEEMQEQGAGKRKSEEGAADEPVQPSKKRRVPGPRKPKSGSGERYVPPPKKRHPGVSFGESHFSETDCYLESGLRKNNDFMRNTVHRHEPPVTAQPISILAENKDMVVVDKPSSLPVHPCGRFRHNTVIFILGKEHNLKELHTIHRLDRMTSGVLMFAKTLEVSKRIDEQIRERQLEKEYVCRVVGEFPEGELICEEPILVVSYKVGVCRVDPKGKSCKTIFQRLTFNGKSSVVKCFPYTGRTHQIRVHLQFLGHPIVNDPIYNAHAWGPSKGKGGKINKTDEELLQALVEEHRKKQSLDILDLSEDSLKLEIEGRDFKDSGVSQPAEEDICADSSVKEDNENEERTPESSLSPDILIKTCKTVSEGCDPSGQQEIYRIPKDPLCGECKIERQDPSPKDLVMYLHALRYKGAEFDYSTTMPEWALENWQED